MRLLNEKQCVNAATFYMKRLGIHKKHIKALSEQGKIPVYSEGRFHHYLADNEKYMIPKVEGKFVCFVYAVEFCPGEPEYFTFYCIAKDVDEFDCSLERLDTHVYRTYSVFKFVVKDDYEPCLLHVFSKNDVFYHL